jgi:hypothetical protein
VIFENDPDLKECHDPFYRCRGIDEDPVNGAVFEDRFPEFVPLVAFDDGLDVFWLN